MASNMDLDWPGATTIVDLDRLGETVLDLDWDMAFMVRYVE